MRDFVENFVVDFHDLVTDPQTLFLGQAPWLHQGHVDADAVFRAPADAEAQTLVALVALHGDLAQLPRRLVDEVPAEQRHQRSCPVAAGAEAVRRAAQRNLTLGWVAWREMSGGRRASAGEVLGLRLASTIVCN